LTYDLRTRPNPPNCTDNAMPEMRGSHSARSMPIVRRIGSARRRGIRPVPRHWKRRVGSRQDTGQAMKTYFGLPLPIDPPSSIAKLGRVIPGVWRCANGLHAEVRDASIIHAAGVSSRSMEMRWDASSGKLIDAVETGWDLKVWLGHLPQDKPSPKSTAPPLPCCTGAHSAGGRI